MIKVHATSKTICYKSALARKVELESENKKKTNNKQETFLKNLRSQPLYHIIIQRPEAMLGRTSYRIESAQTRPKRHSSNSIL